eukprot:TRINITY_DN1094_c1_g5_i1.p1 TRINITY_DN1094_c1_g5~~TRINITY_DN1094_c1_g5_i1.p1  ORF type:complete len:250 (+),score=94.04 TRINITY_DN1094_c1_g5_i1:68-817(+)
MAAAAVQATPPAAAPSVDAAAADRAAFENALSFLSSAKVKQAPLAQRVTFLRRKGVSLKVVQRALQAAGTPAADAELAAAWRGGGYSAPPAPPAAEPAPAAAEPVPAADPAEEDEAEEGEWRPWTLDELAVHTGGEGKRLLLGCKGLVYEVSPDFYGPGKAYAKFAGKDCSWHLAKVKVGDDRANQCWADLAEKDVKVLDDWEQKYQQKYNCVGWVVADWAYAEGTSPAEKPVKRAAPKGEKQGGCAQQ